MSALPEKIRAFIALRLPEIFIAPLVEIQQQLKPRLRDVSWTRPDAMHITLQFLGNIQSATLPTLMSALRDRSAGFPIFEVALAEVGSFNSRVIWAGVGRGAEHVIRLADVVRGTAHGFAEHEENRAFHAHITLGRARRPDRTLNRALREISLPSLPSWKVNRFELIRSELSPHGSNYTTLAEFELDDQ
jgi:RNA 2',3'-cyclic 3'-phosphodiesterase